MRDIILLNFKSVDISDLSAPMIVIYESYLEYSNCIVARLYDKDESTNVVVLTETVEEMRIKIKQTYPHLVRFNQGLEDTESLVEVWL